MPTIFAAKLNTSIEIDLPHVHIYYNGFDTRIDEFLGRIVKLSTDTVDVDLDGALLRYVFADGEMVNLKLLSGGLIPSRF